VERAGEGNMKRVPPNFWTLLLAHILGSYFAYIPTIIIAPTGPESWIYVLLAPLCVPIYLAVMTIAEFPHYHSYMPDTWAAYTVGFAIVCLIRNRKLSVVWLVGPPMILTLLVTALSLPGTIAAARPWQSPLMGKSAPDFSLTSLSGTPFRMSQERGHVVLIDFWGIECPPCRAELKQTISELAGNTSLHDRGFRVWTINAWDDANSTQKFMQDNHYDFNVLLESDGAVEKLYPVHGAPTTYLVGRDGVILKSYSGFGTATDKQLRSDIAAALN
jgi:peroxiredoxin